MSILYENMIQTVLWGITALGMAAFGLRVLLARRKGQSPKTPLIVAGAFAAAALVVVPAIGVVPAGYRGVVYEYSGGVDPQERGEGITLLLPWAQHMRNMSVRTQKVYSDKVFSQSLDLQEITAVVSINFHVEPGKAAELYQTVGPDYPATVIQPALFQRTKAAIGQVKAEDFALGREKLARKVQGQLAAQLDQYGIVVEFVNIEDAIFDKAFITAVKKKIIAEQKAQEEQRLVAAKAAIKQQTIIEAEARAQSVKIEAIQQAAANDLLNASLTGDLLAWRWLNTWDGILPTTLIEGKGENGVLLNVGPSYP